MLPITGNQTIFLISVRHRYYVELVLVLLIRIVTIEANEHHPLIVFLEPSFRGKKRVMEIKDPFQFISRYIFSPLEISPSKKDRGVDKFVICIFLFLKKTPLKERYKFRETVVFSRVTFLPSVLFQILAFSESDPRGS